MSIKYAAAAITKITLHYTYTKLLFNQLTICQNYPTNNNYVIL